MNNIDKIKTQIISLINKELHDNIVDIKTIPQSGSSRKYFRIITETTSYIGTYNDNIEENNAFIHFSKHFKNANLPVPEVIAIDKDNKCYIQTDLGDRFLFDYAKNCISNDSFDDITLELYKKAIDNLVLFQIKGHENLDYSVAYPSPSFNFQSIIDDLNYFKYFFLKLNEEITFNETRLNKDFTEIAQYAMSAPNDFFMYRDFQSRNIIIKNNDTYFIDYQGGRKGPLQYDIISLLYQVKAQIPKNIRGILLQHYKDNLSKYINLYDVNFDKYYNTFVLLRLLQVLGAYGFRGLIQKKQHFIESIPYAIDELIDLKDNLDFPFATDELSAILSQFDKMKNKYQNQDYNTLTVNINSFSYKNGGVPQDLSGNGGGFVFDCRSLPNPGRYDEYKHLTGEDSDVQNFLKDKSEVIIFFENAKALVYQSVDNYIQRGFKNLSVSFGCTGGQHRSVYLAQQMAISLTNDYPEITIKLNHIVQNKHYTYKSRNE